MSAKRQAEKLSNLSNVFAYKLDVMIWNIGSAKRDLSLDIYQVIAENLANFQIIVFFYYLKNHFSQKTF